MQEKYQPLTKEQAGAVLAFLKQMDLENFFLGKPSSTDIIDYWLRRSEHG